MLQKNTQCYIQKDVTKKIIMLQKNKTCYKKKYRRKKISKNFYFGIILYENIEIKNIDKKLVQ